MDNRTFWADLLKFGIISFPAPVLTQIDPVTNLPIDTVALTTGSKLITGTNTNWPVHDVVNTTIAGGVSEFGYVEVTPVSMTGITSNSILYVDAAGTPEAVPVVQVNRTSFIGIFAQTHNAGCTVTQSSFANLQFRLAQSYPVFTVAAVISPTSMQTTVPWGGPALTGQSYTVQLMYVTLPSDMKAIIAAKDEQTGFPVRLHVALQEADFRDPRRTLVAGNPWYSLVDLGANAQGNLICEAWPAPSSARQFSFAYWQQWPDMVLDTDRPPPFINPSMLFYGALADAKMMRLSKDDPYYDPQGAQLYEGRFQQALQDAKNADQAKVLEATRSPWWNSITPGNYDQMQLLPGGGLWEMGAGGMDY